MAAATNAVIKATQGNFKALRAMGVQIDATTIKTKNVDAALKAAAKTFGGAAATRAETFEYRMKRVGIAFGEAKESLGIALMPTLESFFQLLTQKVIPAVQKFVEENGTKMVAAFQTALKAVVGLGFIIYRTFDFVARNKSLFTTLGAIIAAAFVAGKVMAFVMALQAMVKAYRAIRTAAVGAAAAQAAATGGLSVLAASAGVAAFVLAFGGAMIAVNKMNDSMDDAASKVKGLDFSFDGLDKSTADFMSQLKNLKVDLKTGATATGKLTTEQLKLVQSLKTVAALKKLGVTATTETDPIQLEAARINLVKQGAIAEQERFAAFVAARKFEIDANNAATEAAMRYNDILNALGDAKITPAEFQLLAAKWGITTNAAQLYVETIVSISDKKADATDVVALAERWGVTYEQAAKYLDFFAALNDGTLSDAEIGKLQEKWGFTKKAVIDYAAVFAAADDGKIDLAEINALALKWGMTQPAAEDYVAKILEEFGFEEKNLDGPISISEAWIAAYGDADIYKMLAEGEFTYDPSITAGADAAADAWNTATDAATAYAAAANAGISASVALIAAQANATAATTAAAAAVAAANAADNVGGGADAKHDQRVAAEAAAKAAKAAAAAAAANAAAAAAVVVPPENPGAGAGGFDFMALAKGGIVTSPTLSLIGEAGPEAVIPLSRMGGMGGSITINVQGSVISEGDLVAQIRNAILQGQNSGLSITKSAVSI